MYMYIYVCIALLHQVGWYCIVIFFYLNTYFFCYDNIKTACNAWWLNYENDNDYLHASNIGWHHVGNTIQTHHDRAQGRQLVIERARLRDTARLEGELKAATAHAETHRVHVHAAGVGRLVVLAWIVNWDLCVHIAKHCRS